MCCGLEWLCWPSLLKFDKTSLYTDRTPYPCIIAVAGNHWNTGTEMLAIWQNHIFITFRTAGVKVLSQNDIFGLQFTGFGLQWNLQWEQSERFLWPTDGPHCLHPSPNRWPILKKLGLNTILLISFRSTLQIAIQSIWPKHNKPDSIRHRGTKKSGFPVCTLGGTMWNLHSK